MKLMYTSHPGIIFAVITALVFALWTVFHQQASNQINTLLGAILVSVTAVILGIILLLPKLGSTNLYLTQKGIVFVILAGISAFAIDYFALKTYGSGLPISIGGPIIIGGSIAIASISVTFPKVIALTFISVGSAILSALSK